MKGVVKTDDQVMDNLLRAHARRAQGQECSGFDADLANAYVERSLTAIERTRYEGHLSVCHPCRKGVLALSRMAEAEQPHIPLVVSEAKTGWLEPIRGMFAALATPRVALAAVAVIALAVSVPLMLSRQGKPTDSQQAGEMAGLTSQGRAETAPSASSNVANSSTPVNTERGIPTPMMLQAEAQKADTAQRGQQVAAQPSPAEQPVATANAGAEPTAPQQTPKEGDKDQAAKTDEVARRNQEAETRQPATPAPPPPAAAAQDDTRLAHIDPKKAKSLGDKDTAEMHVLKPGDPSVTPGEEKEKKETITAKDSQAPATESSAKDAREGGIANPGPARRERSGARAKPPSGSPDRKIGGKRFWLSGDTWTDREFAGKEIPVVTIVRNSEKYHELLAKHKGLKIYFTNFADDQSAIIVYKDIAYRLVPQK